MRVQIGDLHLFSLVCLALAAPGSSTQQPLGHANNGASTDGLPFSTSALEEYIEAAMENWHAPGMAVAIINGNETWAKVSFSHTNAIPHGKPVFPITTTKMKLSNETHLKPRASATPLSLQHQ